MPCEIEHNSDANVDDYLLPTVKKDDGNGRYHTMMTHVMTPARALSVAVRGVTVKYVPLEKISHPITNWETMGLYSGLSDSSRISKGQGYHGFLT
jgi:hypothetical protein